MASITGSNQSPYNGQLFQDAQLYVSAAFPTPSGFLAASGSTPSINFGCFAPWPTTDAVTVNLFISALTGSSGGLSTTQSLQESIDNVSWNNIVIFNTILNSSTDNLSTSASTATNVQVKLGPLAKQYLRTTITVPQSGSAANGITGSYGVYITT